MASGIIARPFDASDAIVEIGSSGIWNYTKYASGRCEVWARENAGTLTKDGTLNGWNYVLHTTPLPSFILSVTGAVASAKWGTGISWGDSRDVTRDSFRTLIVGNQDDVNCSIEMHAWGTYA